MATHIKYIITHESAQNMQCINTLFMAVKAQDPGENKHINSVPGGIFQI